MVLTNSSNPTKDMLESIVSKWKRHKWPKSLLDFEPLDRQEFSVLFVDPETVSLILEVGDFLLSLIGGGDAKFEELRQQYLKIAAQLNAVMNRLEVLGVQISKEFIQQDINRVTGSLDTYLDNRAVWKAQPAASRAQIETLYLDIQQGARMLLPRGFGVYNTLALAMTAEIELMSVLSSASSVRKNVVERYRSYFRMATDPSVSTSLTAVRIRAQARKTEIETTLVTGERRAENVSNRQIDCQVWFVTSGSFQTGVSVRLEKRSCKYREPPEGRHGGYGPLTISDLFVRLSTSEPSFDDRQLRELEAIRQDVKVRTEEYDGILAQISLLSMAESKVRSFEAAANEAFNAIAD